MSWQKRLSRDLKEMKECGMSVEMENDSRMFITRLSGPKDSPYEGYEWMLRFTIGEKFPFTSPSVGFVQKIFHPNVDEASGSICLDALNKQWSPSFTLKNIVETILPLLLSYPNPDDPLNREAALMLKENPSAFAAAVQAHNKKYALVLSTEFDASN